MHNTVDSYAVSAQHLQFWGSYPKGMHVVSIYYPLHPTIFFIRTARIILGLCASPEQCVKAFSGSSCTLALVVMAFSILAWAGGAEGLIDGARRVVGR